MGVLVDLVCSAISSEAGSPEIPMNSHTVPPGKGSQTLGRRRYLQ